VAAVTLSAYQEYAPLMPSLWGAYRDNIVTTLAAPEPATQIVAEQVSRIVGAVLLYPVATDGDGRAPFPRPYPEVRLLAVARAARSKRTIALLPKKTRIALGKEGGKAARRKRKTR